MLDWIAKHRINEYSDVIGLLITLVGFAVTIFTLWRSRRVAEAALEIARGVRDDLKKVETVAEFATVIASMEEIKRLHRKGERDGLPERYSQLRRSLITLKGAKALLTDDEQTSLQQAISQFAGFERQIEKALANDSVGKLDFPKQNRIVSGLIDEVHAVVVRLKAAIGDLK